MLDAGHFGAPPTNGVAEELCPEEAGRQQPPCLERSCSGGLDDGSTSGSGVAAIGPASAEEPRFGSAAAVAAAAAAGAAGHQEPSEEQPSSATAAPAPISSLAAGGLGAYGEAQFAEAANALLGLLCQEQLPPLALHTLGWLLNQLLSVSSAGEAAGRLWIYLDG